MSDAIEKTAGGATRILFGSIAFILLMVGIEGMFGKDSIGVPLALILILFGIACSYVAVFWENAKKHIAADTQIAIANFAQSRVTKFGMLFLVLQTIILSPFIEQRRWPFSYPVDPAIYQENSDLRNQLNRKNADIAREKELADKWRFSNALRNSQLNCQYLLEWSPRAASTSPFWTELFSASGWLGKARPAPLISSAPPGITIRAKDNPRGAQCAELVQRDLSEFYSNPPPKIIPHQQTEFLNSCAPDACIQIEVDY